MRRGSFFVFLCLGMLPAVYFLPFNTPVIVVTILGACLAAASGVVLLIVPEPVARRRGLYLAACGLGLCLGLTFQSRLNNRAENYYRDYTAVTGYTGYLYRDSVPASQSGFIHSLELESVTTAGGMRRTTAKGRVTVICRGGEKYFSGRRLVVRAGLERSEAGETHFFSFPGAADLEPGGFRSPGAAFRCRVYQSLEQAIGRLGNPAAALFKALFLGAREELAPGLSDHFRQTGTLHLLALSGLHVGIIYLFISLLLLPLRKSGWGLLAGTLLVLAYLFVIGPRPSLLRASLMLIFLTFSRFLYRQTDSLNILAMSAVIILWIDPAAGRTLSFQLSFLALLGIILFSGRLSGLFSPWIPRFLLLPLASSIGVQLATAPLIFRAFGVLYPAGILVTLLLVPVVTVFLWAGILFLILGLLKLSFITSLAFMIMNLLYRVIAGIAGYFSFLPGLTFTWHPWLWAPYLLLFALVLFDRRARRRFGRPSR